VISRDSKYLLTSDSASELHCSSFWTDAEISEKMKTIVHLHAVVQTFENRLIHPLDSFEGTIAVTNYILVAKMKNQR